MELDCEPRRVPVLSRPNPPKRAPYKRSESPIAGASPGLAGRDAIVANMDDAPSGTCRW